MENVYRNSSNSNSFSLSSFHTGTWFSRGLHLLLSRHHTILLPFLALFAFLTIGSVNVWGEDFVWDFGNSSGSIASKSTDFTSPTGNKTLTYVGGSSDGWNGSSPNIQLKMGGATQWSSSVLSSRYFTFKAPSANGTISVSFAGTASGNEMIWTSNGDYQVINPETNKTKTSALLSGLTAGTTDVYIAFSAKCYIYSITWTEADAPAALDALYSSDIKASMATGASINVSSSGMSETSGSGWTAAYSKYYKSSSTNKEATITFSPALSLVSGNGNSGKVRVYYGSTDKSNNATIISEFKVNNGADLGDYGVIAKEKIHIIDYTIPSGTETLSTIYLKMAVSNACIFHVDVLTNTAAPSDAYDIHIGKNNDNYTDEHLTNTSGDTWSKAITLEAGSYYEFKVKKTPSAGEAAWYGNNGSIVSSIAAWDFDTEASNCKLYTTVAGSYTFSWDASTNKLTVTYPAGDHPTKRIYMACGSTWCNDSPKFFVHSWGVTDYNTQVQQTACGEYYADIIWYNDYFQFTRNSSEATAYNDHNWNYSQNLTYNSSTPLWTCTGWSDGKGNFSASAYSPTTYTITFAGNGNTSGSMSNITGIACDANQTIPANAFTKTGNSFTGWIANVDVKIGGSIVTAGTLITNGATIQNISQNITLTAQWEAAATYTLTASAAIKTGRTGTFTGSTTITNSPVSSIVSSTAVSSSANTFTVGGTTVTAPATIAGTVDVTEEDPAETTPLGCTWRFDHWENLPATVTADVSNIHAVYVPTFNLVLDTDGGTINAGAIDYYVFSGADDPTANTVLPTNVTKSGFTFAGWKQATSGTTFTAINGHWYGDFADSYRLVAQWIETGDCTPQSLVKTVLASTTTGTTTGYNGNEYAGTPTITTFEGDPISGGYKLKGSSKLFVTLKKGDFVAGDKINIVITKASDLTNTVGKLPIFYNASSPTLLTTIDAAAAGTYSYILTPADITTLGSNKTIGVFRSSGTNENNAYIKSVEVEGCRDEWSTYNVTYADGGATSGTVPTDATDYAGGTSVTVLGNTGGLAKTDYTFIGWTDGVNVYTPGQTFTITGNTTLTAVWEETMIGDCVTWDGTSSGFSSNTRTIDGKLVLNNANAPNNGEITPWSGESKRTCVKIDGSGRYVEGTFGSLGDLSDLRIAASSGNASSYKYVIVLMDDENTALSTTEATALTTSDAFASVRITIPANATKFRIYRQYDDKDKGGGNSVYVTYVKACYCALPVSPAAKAANTTTSQEYTQNTVAGSMVATASGDVTGYQWYSNEENNTTSGTLIAGATTGGYVPPTTLVGTTYYYCEIKNACGSVFTNTVTITINDPRPAPTADWTGTYTTPTHGGGGYTVTVVAKNNDGSALWDGTLTEDMLTASDGVILSNIVVDNSTKNITATYGVTGAAASPIIFYLALPASTIHRAAVLPSMEIGFSECLSAEEQFYYSHYVSEPLAKSSNCSALISKTTANTISLTTSSASEATGTRSTDDVTGIVDGTNYNLKSSAKYIKMSGGGSISFTTTDVTTIMVQFVTASNDNCGLELHANTADGTLIASAVATSKQYKFQTLSASNLAAGTYFIVAVTKEIDVSEILVITGAGTGGTLTTTLQWSNDLADGATVEKLETDMDFSYTASLTGANDNTLGAITYSSSNEALATVSSNGTVSINDNITWGTGETTKDVTISAILAPSGCYKGKTITYTLRIQKHECEDEQGTISVVSSSCSEVVLTVTGYSAGATIKWYKDGSLIAGATSETYTATTVGTYSAVTHLTCDLPTLNTAVVTFSNPTATAIVDEWYVKNGRRTPDVELATITDFTSWYVTLGGVVVWNSDGTVSTGFGGCEFLEKDGVVYLAGCTPTETAISGIGSGDVILTVTAYNGCTGATTSDITIHKQATTAKPSIAFVVDGTKDGDVDDVSTAKTSERPLWIYLSDYFSLTGCNAYWTTQTKKLRQYYSQFDAIVITDDPNTGTKSDHEPKIEFIKAMGNMVDVRPLLTMEAYVGKYKDGNWGVYNASPSSPDPREYIMKLQCQDHAIYAGLVAGPNVRIEEVDGIEYWYVTMVDENLSPYKGTSESAEDLPALQGFDPTKFKGMLGIGTIADESLQGAVERQKEVAARMMIIGIQHNAMAALTTEGKQIIKNAINYLLQTDMDYVSDCSNYFIGGDASKPRDWHTAANWTSGKVPDPTIRARILAPCEVSANTAKAASIDIVVGGKTHRYKDGASECEGTLTIKADGALIVEGTVRRVDKAPNYTELNRKPTTPSILSIQATSTNAGTLIFNNEDGDARAAVQMYSKATTNGSTDKTTWTWQYIGTPFSDVSDARENYYESWLYSWNGTGWTIVPQGGSLEPFTGYCITHPTSGKTYNMSGTLATTANQDIDVPASKYVVAANSWVAPIDINTITDDDMEGISDKAIYFFNTGKLAPGDHAIGSATADDETRYAPSTYVAAPIHAARYTGEWQIPSMQGFYVWSENAGTLHLDYDKHVRPSTSRSVVSGKMHAPRRANAESGEPEVLKLIARGNRYDDRLIILERQDFTRLYESGWDGEAWGGSDLSPMVYITDEAGINESVSAIPEFEGTVITFRAGEDEAYTFQFNYSDDAEPLYLLDTDTKIYTRVLTDNAYTFTTSDKAAHQRFILTRSDSPEVATGVGETSGGSGGRPLKFINNGKMYIFVNGILYDATGKVVR